jgi:hypothetical protein
VSGGTVVKGLLVLLLFCSVIDTHDGLAQAVTDADRVGKTGPTAIAPPTSNAQAPMPLRMRGTVKKFSATTGILSLSTANGTAEFKLAAETRIRQDSRTIEACDLEKLIGWRVVVHYREARADRTVESVHVIGGS